MTKKPSSEEEKMKKISIDDVSRKHLSKSLLDALEGIEVENINLSSRRKAVLDYLLFLTGVVISIVINYFIDGVSINLPQEILSLIITVTSISIFVGVVIFGVIVYRKRLYTQEAEAINNIRKVHGELLGAIQDSTSRMLRSETP